MENSRRREIKFIIDRFDALYLTDRFNAIARLDKYCNELCGYTVTSLYFDTVDDAAYLNKLYGVTPRNKYRLRYYGNNKDDIKLEHKITDTRTKHKQSTIISRQVTEEILRENIKSLRNGTNIEQQFYISYNMFGLRPKIITQYNRLAWVYGETGVRITIDKDISVSNNTDQFLSDTLKLESLGNSYNILEVKYTNFIPSIILGILRFKGNIKQDTFSKYEAGRIFY